MLAIVSCRDSANIYVSDELPPIWPDYTSVTIPINIAPLDFGMADGVEFTGMKRFRVRPEWKNGLVFGREDSPFPDKEVAQGSGRLRWRKPSL